MHTVRFYTYIATCRLAMHTILCVCVMMHVMMHMEEALSCWYSGEDVSKGILCSTVHLPVAFTDVPIVLRFFMQGMQCAHVVITDWRSICKSELHLHSNSTEPYKL